MQSRFAGAAQLWLVGDHVAATGEGRALACPTLQGSGAFQVFARRVSGDAAMAVHFQTGPTDEGPWETLATVACNGSTCDRAAIPSDRLNSYVRGTYEIDGEATYDIALSLIADAKYASESLAIGASDIEGSPMPATLSDWATTQPLLLRTAYWPTGDAAADALGPQGFDARPISDAIATANQRRTGGSAATLGYDVYASPGVNAFPGDAWTKVGTITPFADGAHSCVIALEDLRTVDPVAGNPCFFTVVPIGDDGGDESPEFTASFTIGGVV